MSFRTLLFPILIFLFSLSPLVADFSKAEPYITHKPSAYYLKRLYNVRWIGSFDVRPCVDLAMDNWLLARGQGDFEQAQSAIVHMKSELIKALSLAKIAPSWITFHDLEHLEMESHLLGCSKQELKKYIKVLVLLSGGVFVGYLLKKRSEALFNHHVAVVERKVVAGYNKFLADLDVRAATLNQEFDKKTELLDRKLDEKGALLSAGITAQIADALTQLDASIEKYRAELAADAEVLRTKVKADGEELRTNIAADANTFRANLKQDAAVFRANLNSDIDAKIPTTRNTSLGVAAATAMVSGIPMVLGAVNSLIGFGSGTCPAH